MSRLLPNVFNNFPELINSVKETIYMVGISGFISIIVGTILGVIIVITNEGGILENKFINKILDYSISLIRSIPFIILLAALMPITRYIVGNATGTKGAIVPLVFATIPFLAKQVENSLLEVDSGLIEAAKSMGCSDWDIIYRVFLKEGLNGIIRGITITLISLIGLSAMAGSIGGGGLGDFAIRYGYQRYQKDITFITIIIILTFVKLIEFASKIITSIFVKPRKEG